MLFPPRMYKGYVLSKSRDCMNEKTFEGGENFPPLPFFIPYLIKYWFAAGNGAFRFCPSDFFGQPRPLAFVGDVTK